MSSLADTYAEVGLSVARRLLASARARIAELDAQPDPLLSRYEERFRQWTDVPPAPVERREFLASLAAARVVLVGDFATSAEPKWLLARLASALPGSAVALNFAPAARQPALDAMARGTISPAELLLDTLASTHLPVCATMALGRLLLSCRRGRVPAFFFEPDAFDDLAHKDDLAADRILSLASQPRRAPLLVLAGELRLCDQGLPARLAARLGPAGVACVYLDLDEPYLALAAASEGSRGVFSLGPERWCVSTQSPLAKYLSFLAWSENEEPIRATRLTSVFADCVVRIAQRFDLSAPALAPAGGRRKWTVRSMPRIFQPGDPRFLPAVARGAGIGPADLDFLADRILAGESRMIPELGVAYIGRISGSHVAEEAAHFLRSLTGGAAYADGTREDAFFGVAVHEAAGFLGSKVIVPDRQVPARAPTGPGVGSEELAHLMGYQLGKRLFALLERQPDALQAVRSFFLNNLVEPGAAKKLYFDGVAAVAGRRRTPGRRG